MGDNLPLGLLVLTGGAVAAWAGITDPEGGVFAGLRNIVSGAPNVKHASTTAAAFISSIVPGGTGGAAPADPGALGTSPESGTPTGTRAAIIATAQSWLGVPYAWGGHDRHGVDCSGLVAQVYGAHGINLAPPAAAQQLRGKSTVFPQPADLVFFGYPASHVGIVLDGGSGRTVIHSPHPGAVVRIETVDSIAKSLPGEPVTFRNVLGNPAPRKARAPRLASA